jgi:phosphatidylglycerophosphate synthase
MFSIIVIGGKFIDPIIDTFYPNSIFYAIIIDLITLFPAIIILLIIWQRAIIKKYYLNEEIKTESSTEPLA